MYILLIYSDGMQINITLGHIDEVDRVAFNFFPLGIYHLNILARMSSFVTLPRRIWSLIFFFIFLTSIRSIVSLSCWVARGNCSETKVTSRVLRAAKFFRISCSSLSWWGGLQATRGSRIVNTRIRIPTILLFCILGSLWKKEVCIPSWFNVD